MATLRQITNLNVSATKFLGVFQGIASNQVGPLLYTFQVPAAWLYETFYLLLQGITATANMAEIRVKIGGNPIQVYSGAELNLIQEYDKGNPAGINTVIALPQRTRASRGGYSWISGDNKSFAINTPRDLAGVSGLNCGSAGGGFGAITDVTIEIVMINTPNVPITVSVYADVTPPVPGGPGMCLRTDRQSKVIANGTVSITKSEMGMDALRKYVRRIHLFAPTGVTFDNFRLRYNQNDWKQLPDNLRQFINGYDFLHVDQSASGLYVIDMTSAGFLDEVLDMQDSGSDLFLQFDAAGVVAPNNNLIFMPETLGLPLASNSNAA